MMLKKTSVMGRQDGLLLLLSCIVPCVQFFRCVRMERRSSHAPYVSLCSILSPTRETSKLSQGHQRPALEDPPTRTDLSPSCLRSTLSAQPCFGETNQSSKPFQRPYFAMQTCTKCFQVGFAELSPRNVSPVGCWAALGDSYSATSCWKYLGYSEVPLDVNNFIALVSLFHGHGGLVIGY